MPDISLLNKKIVYHNACKFCGIEIYRSNRSYLHRCIYNDFEYHIDFCADKIRISKYVEDFNPYNYNRDSRKHHILFHKGKCFHRMELITYYSFDNAVLFYKYQFDNCHTTIAENQESVVLPSIIDIFNQSKSLQEFYDNINIIRLFN